MYDWPTLGLHLAYTWPTKRNIPCPGRTHLLCSRRKTIWSHMHRKHLWKIQHIIHLTSNLYPIKVHNLKGHFRQTEWKYKQWEDKTCRNHQLKFCQEKKLRMKIIRKIPYARPRLCRRGWVARGGEESHMNYSPPQPLAKGKYFITILIKYFHVQSSLNKSDWKNILSFISFLQASIWKDSGMN